MTGTKQLLGHFYRLLDLLWQMISRGRPTPTNSNGKKPVVGTITCTGIAKRSSSTSNREQNLLTTCSCTHLPMSSGKTTLI
jgi:hypothetical protein